MFTPLIDIYKNDKRVGAVDKYVLIGEQAFARCGLTTLFSPVLQCSTLSTGITGIWSPVVIWYFNPFADKYTHTKPSPVCENILEPTAERAIIEYIIFKDYFDEFVLIEGLKTYMFNNPKDYYERLLEESKIWHLPQDLLDYWIKEAVEDEEV